MTALNQKALVLGLLAFFGGSFCTAPAQNEKYPVEGRLSQGGLNVEPEEASSRPEQYRHLRRKLRGDPPLGVLINAALLHVAGGDLKGASALTLKSARRARTASELNDTAVLLLAEWRIGGSPDSLLKAYGYIDESYQRDRHLLEAKFNKGLIEYQLHAFRVAKNSWQEYLELDAHSAWATKARGHYGLISAIQSEFSLELGTDAFKLRFAAGDLRSSAEIVQKFTQQVREYLGSELMAAWSAALNGKDYTDVLALEHLAVVLSRCLTKNTGDRLAEESVAALRESTGLRRQELIRGHLLFAEALLLLEAEAVREAKEKFQKAQVALASGNSPFEAWARFYEAVCHHREDVTGAALREAESLSAQAKEKSYWNLVAMAEWLRGLILLERADPYSALERLRESHGLFVVTNEELNQASTASLIANCLDYMGQFEESWEYRHVALALVAKTGDAQRGSVIYGAAARAVLKRDMFAAALLFQSESLLCASELNDPRVMAEAFWWRAMIFEKLGRPHRARRDILVALEYCLRIPHEQTRSRTFAGLSVTQGAVNRYFNPVKAIASLTRALEVYRTSGYDYLLTDIYVERAISYEMVGDYLSAEADYSAALLEFQRVRARASDRFLRSTYYERAERATSGLIALHIDQKNSPAAALAVAEASKARTLLDELSSRAEDGSVDGGMGLGRVYSEDEIQLYLPPGATLIQFSVLPDRVLVWRLGNGIKDFIQVPLQRRHLSELVLAHAEAVRSRGSSLGNIREVGGDLFDILLRSVLDGLPWGTSLVIVPDKELSRVPFSALWDREESKYLVELYPLILAPSGSVIVELLRVGERRRLGGEALIVGNPSFDRRSDPFLAELTDAEAEARYVADLVPDSMLLTGAEATKTAILTKIEDVFLFHFSGHVLAAQVSPGSSCLLLADGGEPSQSRLYAQEIYMKKFSKLGLAVLSACSAANGYSSSLEGVSSLAVSFIAAGASNVIAPLWEVDDSCSRRFFEEFYIYVFGGAEISVALQRSQLAMLKGASERMRHPSAWAGYQLIGVPPKSPSL